MVTKQKLPIPSIGIGGVAGVAGLAGVVGTKSQTTPPVATSQNSVAAPSMPANYATQKTPTVYTPPTNVTNQTIPNTVPTPPITNAALGGNSPTTGYGGATYGSSAAANQAIAANQSRLKTDSDFLNSEITRTLGVIEARKAQGLDVSDQMKYLTYNLGYDLNKSNQVQPTMPQMVDPVYAPRSASELQQSAGDSLAIERAALQNAVRTQIQAIKNAAEYSNRLIQDERVLQDQSFARNNNPFSGRTAYDKATVLRGRGIDDSARAAQITNQIQSYETELANFDKLAPERQRQIYNELLALEREFGLNVGNLTGNYGGQRTLQGQQFDWQRDMDIVDRTGNLNGQRTLQGQAYDRSIYESDRNYDYQIGRDAVMDERWMTEFEENRRRYGDEWAYQQVRDSIRDEQWKREFDESVRQFGLRHALDQFQAQTARQNANTSAERAASSGTSGLTANQVLNSIKARYSVPIYRQGANGQKIPNGTEITTNPKDREQMFLDVVDAIRDNDAALQIMRSLGLTMDEINMYYTKHSG